MDAFQAIEIWIVLGLAGALFVLLTLITRRRLPALRRELATLLEVGLLFLPAIPAYLWLWPNVQGDSLLFANLATYVYVLAGTLFIGLRRWSWEEMGVNNRGLWVCLLSGVLLISGRVLVVLAVDWGLPLQPLSMPRILADLGFYLLLVGPVEELLFRGLVYRALLDWRGLRWAIWGSSLIFVLWHIFGKGALVGAAMLLYGLIFALMRWRAGGILWAALVHGGMDIASLWLLPDGNAPALAQPQIPQPGLLLLGLALIAAAPLYLWLVHPRLARHRI
jgi:membrane protease YdiL (CAAX protease family)